jgi:hypothetical protein
MPKSRNNSKDHKKRVEKYKANKKREQEALKKKMIDSYLKIQQENLANQQAHTSTEEVSGPEINIDELSKIEEWEPGVEEPNSDDKIDGNIDENVDVDINTDINNKEENDNNN